VLAPGTQLWHNLKRLFDSGEVNVDFWTALLNSLIVAGGVTAAVVLSSALAGFAFAKLRFRGSRLLMLTVVATMMVPVQLGLIPLYIEMVHLGWVNHLQAVMAPNLVSAFGVFLMRQNIVEGVPNELIDACRVDGAHTLRVFWHVVVPAVRPVAAVLGLVAGRLQRAASAAARDVVTDSFLVLSLPGRVLALGTNLADEYPEALRSPADPHRRELLSHYEPVPPEPDDCGARDWSELDQRMHYIAHLFCAFHTREELFRPPFSDEQLASLARGELPGGEL
jgi:ABC-type Fe3+ transport system permease subunit